MAGPVILAGTLDTKGAELRYCADQLRAAGATVRLVDLSTGVPSAGEGAGRGADVAAAAVAAAHPDGPDAVFTGDRGGAVAAMAVAFERWLLGQGAAIGGVLGLGGSGGTALVTPAMRALPVGVPKLVVSTVASGNVAAYVGASDITMMYSVTDLVGLNRISRVVLGNAAAAMAGMAARAASAAAGPGIPDRPALGITMFGVTTPAVTQAVALLEGRVDCLAFHATGTGGASMEKLAESGLLQAVLDLTTTEICDLLVGGVFPCTPDRLGAVARTGIPYVGSCGALDMVNFGAFETVPERFRDRLLYRHNPQVTLMRTTPAENALFGRWIGERLNRCDGPVRFLLPLGGVSLLDAPGQPFHEPDADAALFDALRETVTPTASRRLVEVPHAINDAAFVAAAVAALAEVAPGMAAP